MIENCPAFTEGCPFTKEDDIMKWVQRSKIANCPAFSDGCPFKKTINVSEMREVLKQVPESHGSGTAHELVKLFSGGLT
jgi:hypothetical protein